MQNLLENHYLNLLDAHCACTCLSFDCHSCLDKSKKHHKSYDFMIYILSVPPGKISIQEIEYRLISFLELVHILSVETSLYIRSTTSEPPRPLPGPQCSVPLQLRANPSRKIHTYIHAGALGPTCRRKDARSPGRIRRCFHVARGLHRIVAFTRERLRKAITAYSISRVNPRTLESTKGGSNDS